MLVFLNVFGIINAIISQNYAEWLKNLTANEQFLPNGGFPILIIWNLLFLSVLFFLFL